jgi:hypothetical protein
MNPEEQKLLLELMKKMMNVTQEDMDKVKESTKRGHRIITEWCQSEDNVKLLPQEIKDVQMLSTVNMLNCMDGKTSIMIAKAGFDMMIEAAFNFGKAQPKDKE